MLTNRWFEYMKFFAALLSIVNPVGAIPIFINITNTQTSDDRHKTALIASLTIVMVLFVSLVAGEAILHFFGISISSFRVGGGILILLMAISMMHAHISPARHTEEEAKDVADKDSVAIVPLGIPLLAGPGAISTVILYANRSNSILHYLILLAIILIVAGITWLCLRSAFLLADLLGKTGINIFTRIMGLIMAAIGVEFITNGLKQLLPGLN
ncbi:MAG: YchE family NAAT transporter [Dissulfurimicrobium sp.]|uniref:YchE family NAAT transporter n=1 Tax=Dissulfurimicrobium sp. TaxID=2022436 RepID=UPI00404AA787